MFTRGTFQGLKAFFTIQYNLCSGPYVWNEKVGGDGIPGILVSNSKYHRILFILNTTFCVFFGCYSVINTYLGVHCKGCRSIFNRVMDLSWTQWWVVVATLQYNLYNKSAKLQECFNSYIKFTQESSMKYTRNRNQTKVKDGCEDIIKILLLVSFVNSIPFLSLYLFDHTNPRVLINLWSWSKGPAQFKPYFSVYHIMWIPVEYFILVNAWYAWLFVINVTWTYTKSTTFWLGQLKFGANKHFMENPKDVTLLYRQMQCINTMFNDCFAPLVWPVFIITNVTGHIMCIYSALKLYGKLPMAVYPMYPIWVIVNFLLEVALYTMLGAINHLSISFVKSWTDVVGKRQRMTLKSCRPMAVRVGGYYVIQRTTILTLLLIISNATVNVLLIRS